MCSSRGQSHLNCHYRMLPLQQYPSEYQRSFLIPPPDIVQWDHHHRHHYLSIKFLFLSVQKPHNGSITTPVVWNLQKESQNKVSSTANRYVLCFINARSVGLFSFRIFLWTEYELAFHFQRLLSFQVCSLCPWWEWQTFWADKNFLINISLCSCLY